VKHRTPWRWPALVSRIDGQTVNIVDMYGSMHALPRIAYLLIIQNGHLL
jgi:hypothetical protein